MHHYPHRTGNQNYSDPLVTSMNMDYHTADSVTEWMSWLNMFSTHPDAAYFYTQLIYDHLELRLDSAAKEADVEAREGAVGQLLNDLADRTRSAAEQDDTA